MKTCCAKPTVCVMDYDKFSPSPDGCFWMEGGRRINRVCTHCWTHWFGSPKRVRKFTQAQWAKWINASFTSKIGAKHD